MLIDKDEFIDWLDDVGDEYVKESTIALVELYCSEELDIPIKHTIYNEEPY